LLLRAAGSDQVLARYARELGETVSAEIDGADEDRLWDRVVRFASVTSHREPASMLVRIAVPIAAVSAAVQLCEQAATQHGVPCAITASAGVGSLQSAFFPAAGSQGDGAVCENLLRLVRSRLPRDSSAIVLSCPRELRQRLDLWGPSPTDLDSMRAVKRALDENDILNRGRFLF
jgi:FAD/FMN-containing dehydrogenase